MRTSPLAVLKARCDVSSTPLENELDPSIPRTFLSHPLEERAVRLELLLDEQAQTEHQLATMP